VCHNNQQNEKGDRMIKKLRTEDMRRIMGQKIKILREMNEVTQVELAKILGYSSTGTISLIENGIKGMKNVAVIKAAEFFRVHPVVLFSPTDLDKDELKILSAVMNLFEENRQNPIKMKPYIDILKKILEIAT
jgi:transcriptional regulator with XRE-family HTH domain